MTRTSTFLFLLIFSVVINAQDFIEKNLEPNSEQQTVQKTQINANQDTVTVVGEGFVELAPNLLDMQFTLVSTNMTIAEAKQELDAQYTQVLTVLQQQKIADKDIQATQLRSNPSYEWMKDKRVFKGFQMSRNINVVVRDFDQYPMLLQSLVDADVTMINRVRTRLSDEAGSQELAIIEAIKAAKRKAELMATQFGRSLGDVQYISEGVFQNHFPQPNFKSSRALSAESSVASVPAEMFGLQRINARVQVIFRLQ